MAQAIIVNLDTKLVCAKCGYQAGVCVMGHHLGPCHKGKLEDATAARKKSAAKYAGSLKNAVNRKRLQLKKALKEAVPDEAIRDLGERPPPSVPWVNVGKESPFYWDREQLADFPLEAKVYCLKTFRKYIDTVSQVYLY